MKSKKKVTKTATKRTAKPAPTPVVAVPVVAPAVPLTPPPSVAEKTWAQIRHVELQMFGLPFQTIEKYCTPTFVEPSKLYLTFKIGTVLPIMEEVLKNRFVIERVDKYITVVPIVQEK